MARASWYVTPRSGGEGFVVPKAALAGFPEDEWERVPLGRKAIDVDMDVFDPAAGAMRRCPDKRARKERAQRKVDVQAIADEIEHLKARLAALEAAA